MISHRLWRLVSPVACAVMVLSLHRTSVARVPGDQVGGEFRTNTYTTGLQLSPAVAADGAGGSVVVRQDSLPKIEDVFERRFAPLTNTCRGDCSGDGKVTVNELITGVSIALGELSASKCRALDADNDEKVSVGELVAAVNSALEGCVTPTPTATPIPTPEALSLGIVSVEHTGPGQTPELVFTALEDGVPAGILAKPLTHLAVTIAGPTTDYASYWQYLIQGTGSTGTLSKDAARYRYIFPAPMPSGATGSYAFGLEGYIAPGGPNGPLYASINPVKFVAVTDAIAVPRRSVATDAQCHGCHVSFTAHGGTRRSLDYCVFCHNPNEIDDQEVARFEGVPVDATSESMSFMTHRIHMGSRLTQPYVLGGFPGPAKPNPAGTPIDFSLVVYPGDVGECQACHTVEGHQLPLPSNLLPVLERRTLQCTENPAADADNYCDIRVASGENIIAAETAACIGCHDEPVTAAHAEIMTTADGVATCAVCHAPGKFSDADIYHGT